MQDDVNVQRLHAKIAEVDQKIEELKHHKAVLQMLIDDTTVRLVVASTLGASSSVAAPAPATMVPQAKPVVNPHLPTQSSNGNNLHRANHTSPIVQAGGAQKLSGHQIP